MGVKVVRFPIRDVSVPPSDQDGMFRQLIKQARDSLDVGQTVVVHCRGGLGRAGLVTAAILVAEGMDSTEAIRAVREARPGAIETHAQEQYVHRFAGLLEERAHA